MKQFKIGDLTVKLPIIQGGMGVAISLSGLASAVANQGGIGVISAVGIGMTEPDYIRNFREANKRALKKEIVKARSKTNGVLGVNIMLAVSDSEDLLNIAAQRVAKGYQLVVANRKEDMNSSHKVYIVGASGVLAKPQSRDEIGRRSANKTRDIGEDESKE